MGKDASIDEHLEDAESSFGGSDKGDNDAKFFFGTSSQLSKSEGNLEVDP